MEHASEALRMAFGMLIAILIIAAITFVFTNLKVVPMQDDDVEKVEQTRLFNQEYEVYDKKIMYGVDIISLLNKAQSNNEKYVEGNFLNGNFNYTDYIINIVVTFKSSLTEEIEVSYLKNSAGSVKEIAYANNERTKWNCS